MKKHALMLAICAGLAICSCQKESKVTNQPAKTSFNEEILFKDVAEVLDYYEALCTEQETVILTPRENGIAAALQQH